MERENLGELVSKKLDGELTRSEKQALRDALDSDPEARRTAEDWQRVQEILNEYADSLGEPSDSTRRQVLAFRKPRRSRPWRRRAVAAVAALLMVSFSIGVTVGMLVSRTDRGTVAPVVDTSLLETAVSETWELMPSQVRWLALCKGKLQLDTAPLPLGGDQREMFFVSFLIQQGKGALRPLCQLAVLAGQQAEFAWEEHGRWALRCRPVVTDDGARLQVCVSLQPGEAELQAISLTSEPKVQTGRTFEVASSRIGGKRFSIWAQVRRIRVGSLIKGSAL